MSTTTKTIFRNQVREYVLNHINCSIPELVHEFKVETSWQRNTVQERFIDWLNGLPTETSFAFSNYEQQVIASEWFANCGDCLDDRFNYEHFYYWIYKEIVYLFKQETGKKFTSYVLD